MVAVTGGIDGVRRTQGYRQLVVISIANSAIAAALMVGPGAGGQTFAETVQKGLGLPDDSIVWRLLCLSAVIVSVGAAISARKSNDSTEPSITVELSKSSVSAEVVAPRMTIVYGLIILAITAMGFVRGQGVATVEPSSLALSISSVKYGDTYSATAKGFLPGEVVKFSWDRGSMADVPPADSGGSTTLLPIRETAPPGNYTLTATGQTSWRTATAEVQVVQPGKVLVVQPGN
jgi:hypothetical protein